MARWTFTPATLPTAGLLDTLGPQGLQSTALTVVGYGDSGGPNFGTVNGKRVLVATTITGDTPCYATNVVYRTDTVAARAFLSPFVALP